MQPDEVLSRLTAATLLEEDPDQGLVRLSESYQSQVEGTLDELEGVSSEQLRTIVAERRDEEETRRLLDVCEGDPELIARYLAVTEMTDDYDFEERLRLLPVLEQFTRPAPDSGAPENFTPTHPDRLPFVLNLYRRAVVYVWRDDCPPCDRMKSDLESVVSGMETDLALLAVYGPDDPQLLYDRYNVRGGPITLFVLEGEVDSRLHGPQFPSVIESEIETLESL